MPDGGDLHARVSARDGGLRRLRAVTRILAVAMTALAGVLAALAAQTASGGRKLVRVHPRAAAVTTKPTASRTKPQRIPPPPALPAAGAQQAPPSPAPAPAAPAQAPTPAPAPPVAVSGGS